MVKKKDSHNLYSCSHKMFQIKLKNGPFSFYEEVKIVKLSTDGALRTTTDGNQLQWATRVSRVLLA